jgi:site-specific DNA-methyltransferase (adenine-specific)
MTVRILTGDCREHMAAMEAGTIDAIVTDPPYGLEFMGKDWDDGIPGKHFWELALIVAKPGAHLLAFGGTRTHHRLACAIEDAGWEIRDCLMWLYGSGFPKSLDVSKAIDKAAGAEREVVGTGRGITGNATRNHTGLHSDDKYEWPSAGDGTFPITAPATDLARQWEGWGTALKPAWEPIIMARKPLTGTVAANVTTHGTGALNVDGCRIGTTDETLQRPERRGFGTTGGWANYKQESGMYGTPKGIGRWPANVLLDEDAAAMLDAQSGESVSKQADRGKGIDGATFRNPNGETFGIRGHNDTGGASRFFKVVSQDNVTRDSEATIIDAWERPGQSHNDQTDTTSPARDTYAATSLAGFDSPTLSNGNGITDPSRTDTKFTTSTATSKTTESTTLNLSRPPTTSAFTQDANDVTASGSNLAPSAASSNASTLSTGISASRVGHSTDDADRATFGKSLPTNSDDDQRRFHYTAKASRSERDAGLGGPDGVAARNSHPT